LLSILTLLVGCKEHSVQQWPGICISFDDRTIDEWFDMRGLLIKYNAKVTFFVTQFDSLSDEEVNKLRILQDDGHEIGSHGGLHVFSEAFIKENSYREYLDQEIDRSVASMHKQGFLVESFAYPYGSKYWLTDQLLSKRFKAIRSVEPLSYDRDLSGMNNVYSAVGKENTFSAVSIDHHSFSPEMINAGIKRAVKNKEVLLLYGHRPVANNPAQYEFQLSDLEFILSKANAAGLKFYTFRELTSDK